jgi:hypothetical protein
MDRAEHLQWCKDRALEYTKAGDITQAFASFTSDMSKHPETANHPALQMGSMMLFGGHMDSVAETEKWINGFN